MVFIGPVAGAGGKNRPAFRHTGPNRNHEFQMSADSCSEHNFVNQLGTLR